MCEPLNPVLIVSMLPLGTPYRWPADVEVHATPDDDDLSPEEVDAQIDRWVRAGLLELGMREDGELTLRPTEAGAHVLWGR